MLSITLIIIILTAIVSFTAMSNEKIINDLIFYPPAITNQNQWYRFISCALIHADFAHLAFNMWGLWIFGENLESAFKQIFPNYGGALYVAFYVLTQFFCLIPTYIKNKDNYYYRSLGASGAVSGIVFATILIAPTMGLGLLFIPIYIPAFLFGIIYLAVSYYLAKKGRGSINHEAHLFGALAGLGFFIIMCYAFSTFDPIRSFTSQVSDYLS